MIPITREKVADSSATIPRGTEGLMEDWALEMSQYYYITDFCAGQVVGEYQLFRFFYYDFEGHFPLDNYDLQCQEYARLWMDEEGNEIKEYFDDAIERLCPYGFYWEEDLDSLYPYPESEFTPWLQKRGLDLSNYPSWWCCGYQLNSARFPIVDCAREVMGHGTMQGSQGHVETLLKLRWYYLIEQFALMDYDIDTYWPSVKICIRNHYEPEDWEIWLEYIDLLIEAGKDLRNAHYVCPEEDIETAHEKLYEKLHKEEVRNRKRREEEMRIARELRKAEEDKQKQDNFLSKSKYFGIKFSVNGLDYHVLSSLDEVKAEADAMHHCLWVGGVYAKVDTICISCTKNGERVETIELSLRTGKVIQHHGKFNSDDSPYHATIAKDVEQNYYQFKQLAS